MTTLREAAQQALEALEEYQYRGAPFLGCDGAVAALRAALAQEQEAPVELEQVNLSRCPQCNGPADNGHDRSIPPNPYLCTKCMAEPVVGIIESKIKGDSHQTLDDAMRLPRAMAQAYESGYSAGVANEREACAKVCESRFMGDLTREDIEARRCAAAIRARREMP